MNTKMTKKGIKPFLIGLSAFIGIIALIYYIIWNLTGTNQFNILVLLSLIAGIVCNCILLKYFNSYIMILATTLYSVSLFQLLRKSVGSFVDAIQGINMFGNAAQVPHITTFSIILLATIIITIAASFSTLKQKL